jgi:polysaccharide export outer membrane protein
MTHARHLSAALLLAAFLSGPARAAYLLDVGDVLEVSVLGVPDYRRRVAVNVDGEVSLPLVGEVRAAGLGLAELRRRVTDLLAGTRKLQEPDVTVELVELRPFYVTGDVSRPGAVPFRGGLTVRSAVALAGGYDALRFRSENPLLMAPELRSQSESLWIELVRRQARALTLQAEMDGKDVADLSSLRDAPVPKASVAAVADVELRDLKARAAEYAKQKAFLIRAVVQAQENVTSLESALHEQSKFIAKQIEAGERLQASYARGVTPVSRVEEENRSMAMLRNQQIDTTARLSQARRDRDEAARALERWPDERHHRLLAETQDAFVEAERLRASLRASGEKMLYAGAVTAQMKRGGAPPETVIHRIVDGRTVSIQVGENDEVRPGDVLDVVIRPDAPAGPVASRTQ